MELSNIEELLEKYLNAETSLQQEETLKKYFTSNNVAPHLQEYTSLFNYYVNSKSEIYNKPIRLKTKKNRLNWLSIAASFTILFSMAFFWNSYQKEKKALEQYAQVKEALKLLSSNLNKGTEAMETLYAYENTVNKMFPK